MLTVVVLVVAYDGAAMKRVGLVLGCQQAVTVVACDWWSVSDRQKTPLSNYF